MKELTKVVSLNRKEVPFKTSFSLAVFTKTSTADFAEQGAHSADEASISARKEGLDQLYRMWYYYTDTTEVYATRLPK